MSHPTESLNIQTPKQSVRTEGASWMSGETFLQLLEVQLPTTTQSQTTLVSRCYKKIFIHLKLRECFICAVHNSLAY